MRQSEEDDGGTKLYEILQQIGKGKKPDWVIDILKTRVKAKDDP
jgi:hypothetical protein